MSIVPDERSQSAEDIKRDYLRLRRAYFSLLGSLYPSIVYVELCRWRDLYAKAVGDDHLWPIGLPYTPQPTPEGYVPPYVDTFDDVRNEDRP